MKRALGAALLIVILAAASVGRSAETEDATSPIDPELTIAAVGDLNFADPLGQLIIKQGPDYPWRYVAEVLSTADLRLGNLEVMPSLKGQVYTPKKWTLHADPRTVSALISGGFEVVSLANNHAMDFGPSALSEAISLLDQHGILHSGAGRNLAAARAPAVAVKCGRRLSFLSYSLTLPEEFYATATRPGTAPGYESYLRIDIPAAKAQSDLVIVSFHWSAELLTMPKDYQRRLAHLAVDLGADLVIGHHPHVLQGLEIYHGRLIAYSLGNFAFASYSAQSRDSVILLVRLAGEPRQAWIYPVNVDNRQVNFQTRLRQGSDAERVLNDLRRISAPFKTTISSEGDLGIIRLDP